MGEHQDHGGVATKPEVKIALVADVVEACLVLREKGQVRGLALDEQLGVQDGLCGRVDEVDVPVDAMVDAPRVEEVAMSLTIWLMRLMPPSPTSVCLVTVLRSGTPRSSHLTHGKRRVRQPREAERSPLSGSGVSEPHARRSTAHGAPPTESTCKPHLEDGWRCSRTAVTRTSSRGLLNAGIDAASR
jgi:hypothetical protein